jgi:hypothetical protein
LFARRRKSTAFSAAVGHADRTNGAAKVLADAIFLGRSEQTALGAAEECFT